MRARVLDFVQDLRRHGLAISVAESMDALSAVGAAGVEREVLREALAATLVKDERDRPAFDPLFDVAFPLVGEPAVVGRRPQRRRAESTEPGAGRGDGDGRGKAREPSPDARGLREQPDDARGSQARRVRQAALLTLPFAAFTARDVGEARDLVRDLGARLRGRLARRERRTRHGRVDLRRTLRAATASGGVPLVLRRRTRRPGRPDLVALCDLSGSVAAASELLLGLLAPADVFFRRVHLFAYVDRPCPVSIERGHVAPGAPLDLHARSDFGRVLQELWREHAGLFGRTTLLLILGDARNNRLPPRADVLRVLRERVQRVVWLVPEPRQRWDTGDSVLRLYAPSCDAVVECTDLATMLAAVRDAL
ncbi:MAG TPA: VWA domain-containing protein [Candidatus Binatia bacterium]|nr:VWA domain-containing protein [Candidatus Binatia bacterium]